MYLSDHFVPKIRPDLKFDDEEVAESLFIEICTPQNMGKISS